MRDFLVCFIGCDALRLGCFHGGDVVLVVG
jgi:hypothetical protein